MQEQDAENSPGAHPGTTIFGEAAPIRRYRFLPAAAFSLCTLILLICWSALFLVMYAPDIWGKGFRLTIYLRLYSAVAMTLLPVVLPVSLFLFAALQHWLKNRRGRNAFTFRKVLVSGGLVSMIAFITAGFIMPAGRLKFYPLLYAMRAAETDADFLEREESYFTGETNTSDYFELGRIADDKSQSATRFGLRNAEAYDLLSDDASRATAEQHKMLALTSYALLYFIAGACTGFLLRNRRPALLVAAAVLYTIILYVITSFALEATNPQLPVFLAAYGIYALTAATMLPILLALRRKSSLTPTSHEKT